MKGYEKNFVEIIVENFPNMEKEIVNQVQEAQRVPYRIYPGRNILIKLTKTKQKERLLKATREKQQVTYKGNHIHLTTDLSAETMFPLYATCCFSLAAFNSLCLCLVFVSLISMSLGVFLLWFILYGTLYASWT